jgi:serine protease AprX
VALALTFGTAAPAAAAPKGSHPKLDRTLNERANVGTGKSRVIVSYKPGLDLSADARKLGLKLGRKLRLIGGQVVELSNGQLKKLADHPAVESIHFDRPTVGLPNDVVATEAAQELQIAHALQGNPGFTGAGVGVAIIDSGITPWHDDLTYARGNSRHVKTNGGQRVAAFVDLVNGRTEPYDDYGHGTHVAGIIAGNGLRSNGVRTGSAPDAHLVVLKVLNESGRGQISHVIAALDYVVATRSEHNIRVANLSIAAAVLESVHTDPLTLAAKRAVEAGVVVVAASGNLGRNALGLAQYGGVTAPGNAPWVLTVGAYDHQGTTNPTDDVIAPFSSRGPTAIDFYAKPDVVAPGTGIVSLSVPTSDLYLLKSTQLVDGSTLEDRQYLSLTGTSVAAPAVTGTIAVMMQANAGLTPNLAKAIVQYTAAFHEEYDALTQGAGFLNSGGAVELAHYFVAAREGQRYPKDPTWTGKIIWGSQWIGGGAILPGGNAWALTTVWGASHEEDGDNIVWGTRCTDEDCDDIVWGTAEDEDDIVWGTFCADEDCDNIVWGTEEDSDNIVWGTDCGGEDCDNIVWGTRCEGEDCDNIVWGTAEDDDNIVWGTDCGPEDCDNIVWGTECAGEDCDDIVWGTLEDDDNIVWGTRAPAPAPVAEPTPVVKGRKK